MYITSNFTLMSIKLIHQNHDMLEINEFLLLSSHLQLPV